ncbi:serine/threonine-protein kinase [Streptomyces sp. NPDC087270]|uniref:serine/threonine-protein kinase n=1 Tax=Streptomyces sp. NPDC087270 TaxID=3365774 RepID=UPI003810929F
MAGIGIRPLGEDDPRRLGPYRLLWRLTTGGMGRIYLARPQREGPLVAVKTLLAEGVVSEPDRKRFAREVDLARRVDSSYTARLLDADARAERPWMAIDYVPAPSLGDLVRAAGPLPPEALPWLAAGTVQALLALHDKGVVHRDVKPQNILLPLTGPLVIDFGISHAIDKTTTSLTLGTIDYTSPEQALGRRSTQASDVFSLGATLFHLTVGRAPYPETDDGPLQRLARVQAGTLDLSGLPPALAPLIHPTLAAEPEARPTLGELLVRFIDEADRAPAARGAQHRLPVRWTALIDAYEAHGRALDLDEGGAVAMADEHTRPLPPPAPTLVDTRERAARREREEQARQAREQRERELRELAAATRAKAAEAERQRRAEQEAAEAAAAAEAARKKAEREKAEREKAERRGAEQRRAEQRRAEELAAERRAAEQKKAEQRKADQRAAERRAAAAKSKQGESVSGMLLAVVLLVALVAWHPWTGHHGSGSTAGATGNASANAFSSGGSGLSSDDPNTGNAGAASDSTGGDDAGTASDGGSDDSGGSVGSSDGSDGDTVPDTTPPAPTTTTPPPDPTEEAFKAVPVGDCLPVYDTGRGGSTIAWSASVPPSPVSCSGQWGGLVQVTSRTGGSCPSGTGKSSWSYYSASSGDTTRLCLTRVFLPHYCLLGTQSGDSISIGPMTAVDCTAKQVPVPYNQVMWISGVYRAPSGASANNCVQGASDRTRYWAWLVNDGSTLLCTTIYQSG